MAFTPQAIPNPRRFFELQEQYKQRLMEDSQLNKAAALAAEEDMVLNSNLPSSIKVAVAKPLSRQVRQWTKRVRQPGVGFGGYRQRQACHRVHLQTWPNPPCLPCSNK